MTRFSRFFILFLLFSFALGGPSVTQSKPVFSGVMRPGELAGLSCALGVASLVVAAVGVLDHSSLELEPLKDATLEIHLVSANETEMQRQKEGWLAEAPTYMEYLDREFDYLGLSDEIRAEVKESVRVLLQRSALPSDKYQASSSVVASELFVYSVQFTVVRSLQKGDVQISKELFESGVVANIENFYIEGPSLGDLSLAQADVNEADWSVAQFEIADPLFIESVIQEKVSTLLGAEKDLEK